MRRSNGSDIKVLQKHVDAILEARAPAPKTGRRR